MTSASNSVELQRLLEEWAADGDGAQGAGGAAAPGGAADERASSHLRGGRQRCT